MKGKIAAGIFLLILDQASKQLAVRHHWAVANTGLAFGVGAGVSGGIILAVMAAGLVTHGLIKGAAAGSVLIISGGGGNLLDRLFGGSVVDWIRLFGLWFNLADIYISIGVSMLIYSLVYNRNQQK